MPDTPAPAARPVAQVIPAATPDAASTLGLQVGVVVVVALYFAREVLIPITLAILLAFILAPVVALLRRTGLGRVPAVLLAVVAALAIILGLGGVIGTQVAQLATGIPQYAATVESKIDAVRAYTTGRMASFAGRLGLPGEPPAAGPAPAASAPGIPGTNLVPAPPAAVPVAAEPGSSPLALAERYLSPVLSPLATMGIVFVVAIFALLQQEDLRDRLIRLFGATDLHRTTVALDDAARRLAKYLLTQLAVNASFGLVIGAGLYAIGVPNPVLWGMLSALLRFVPYIGSFISAGLPLALAAAVDPGWTMAIWTAALYVVVELTVSQVIEPLLYGHSTGLSPFAVVVSAIFWSWLWGPIGLILSMPLTLCLVVLGRYVDRLEFLDVLLGDRPALTPVESFYQRILAGDADEAQDHAELLLKDRSLSSYYDEVALKGLQLAANDAERGVLQHGQLERIKDTIKGLVAELDGHDDREPPRDKGTGEDVAGTTRDEREMPKAPPPDCPDGGRAGLAPAWRTDAPVLCLAGKGPLDEASSSMLAQLLGKHGLGARVTPYQAASREEIGKLDVTGVAMVCISYLDITGSPSHLRYLMQRLHRRLPGVPVLVGLWPSEDDTLKDDRVRAVIGADYYSTSLREAVNACVEAAHKAVDAAGRGESVPTRSGDLAAAQAEG